MSKKKTVKIKLKPRLDPEVWSSLLSEVLSNNVELMSYFPKDGELWIAVTGESYRSIVIKSDGTWSFE